MLTVKLLFKCSASRFLFSFWSQSHLSQSIHSSLHSLDADTPGRPDGSDPYKDGLRRVQSTDSLGSSGGALQPHGLGGHNNKAKSASQLDESDFGPLVGADCGGFDSMDTSSISSLQPGHFSPHQGPGEGHHGHDPRAGGNCIAAVQHLSYCRYVLPASAWQPTGQRERVESAAARGQRVDAV